jgi:hypothetical protein
LLGEQAGIVLGHDTCVRVHVDKYMTLHRYATGQECVCCGTDSPTEVQYTNSLRFLFLQVCDEFVQQSYVFLTSSGADADGLGNRVNVHPNVVFDLGRPLGFLRRELEA